MTLMQWGNSEGWQGRCDAKCHNAKDPDCDCMCGGAFHGAAGRQGGVEAAVREFWDEVTDRAQREADRRGLNLEIKPYQMNLFCGNE